MPSTLTIRSRTAGDLVAVQVLLRREAERLEALDPRLRIHRSPGAGEAFVAVADGTVVGHLAVEPFALDPDGFDAVWSPPSGLSWYAVALADPAAFTALAAAPPVPHGVDTLMWPSADPAPFLAEAGFTAGSVYAQRPPGPLPAEPVAGVRVRDARRTDTEALVALYLEEIDFHTASGTRIRRTAGAEPGWRVRLATTFDGTRGVPASILVAEQDGEVIGFAEGWNSVADGFAYGSVGYLNSVCVHEPHRGRRIGRLLASTLVDRLAGPDGSTLWFTVGNPLSSRVWPHLGFAPLWTMYVRVG